MSDYMRRVTATSPRGQQRTVELHGQADECPRCHLHLVPKSYTQVIRSDAAKANVEEVLQCTSDECGGIFIAIFQCSVPGASPPRYQYVRSIPTEPSPPKVQPEVAAVSPNFVEVYKQAMAAEAVELHQLTGIGLRKALEFLVKDFASSINPPEERDQICSKTLASCIVEYIPDISLQAVAKRAAWLGNDETHYVRKWEDKDISDLKTLIRLTMNGVDNVLLARKYEQEMPDGKK
jgi:hypothetical protein